MASLNRAVQGLIVHCEWLGKYSEDPGAFGPVSRTTLPVKQRLAALLENDGRELDQIRMPAKRGIGARPLVMKVNVVRDAFAVNNQETSSWDRWREAPPELRTVSHDEFAALDRLSRNPGEPVALVPSWL